MTVHHRLQRRADNGGLLGGGLLGGGGGLLGGGGGFLGGDGGLPTFSIPSITSILNLPGPDTSTTATTTSVQTTTTLGTSLTTSSGSTASSTTLTTSSSTTTSSTLSTTTSSTITTSLTPTSTSTSDTPTQTASPATPTSTVTQTFTNSSSSSSATPTSQADHTPKSFLQNKALSVGVITAASLVGLVLIIALATWAIRKRRNDRLHQDILDYSSTHLVGESHDPEKGAGASSTESSLSGHGGSLGFSASVPPPVPQRQVYQDPSLAYGAAAVAYGVPQRDPSRAPQPYGGQAAYGGAYGAYPQPNNTYENWNYGYGASAAQPSQLAYDQAYGGVEDPYVRYTSNPYENMGMMAGVGAGPQQQAPANPPQRRPSANRKPAPKLDIAVENPISQPGQVLSPQSTVSLSNPPLQPATSSNSANPARARRTSLLDPPAVAGSAESGSGKAYPKLPPPAPLPDEFGRSIGSPTELEEPRRLIVRNE